jgi:hypothetical protein
VSEQAMTSSDRQHPRHVADGRIICHLEPHNVSLTVLNVSRDGFLVLSPMKARIGDVHRFRFIVEGQRDAIFVLSGRVVRCAESVGSKVPGYLTGLEFIDTSNPVCQRAIAQLLSAVTP